MLYSNIKNEKIKNIKKLNQKKYRDRDNLFIVEGEHLVLEAYKTITNIVIISLSFLPPLFDQYLYIYIFYFSFF